MGILNFIKNRKNKNEKKEENVSLINFRSTIPENFLVEVMTGILKNPNNDIVGFEKEGMSVESVYFVGATLCIDVRKDNCGNAITINSDSCGWFNPDKFKEGRVGRDCLQKLESELLIQIKKISGINLN